MIKIYQKKVKDRKLKTLKTFKIGSWIYIDNPSKKELDQFAERFSLERDLLEDAIDPNEVPRVEVENGVTYVFTRVPFKEKERVTTSPALFGLGKDFLFTVSPKPLPFLDKFTSGKINFYTTQKAKLFTLLFSEINAIYNHSITEINKKVRSLSVNPEKINNKDILQFVIFEGGLNDFLAALTPINALLNNILSGKFFKLYEEDKDLVEDVFLANGQLIETCKLNLKSIGNIRESYSTIMTNNLNRVIKLLTALTVMLTVPTIVASFYGMNVSLPFAGSPLAFIWIVTATVFVSLAILGIFIYNRWL